MISWTTEVRPHLLFGALATTVIVVAAFWWLTSPRHDDAIAADYCRTHYALAQDAADTAAVDLMHSYLGGAIVPCGELRGRGQVH
jgi:hypothetical protein